MKKFKVGLLTMSDGRPYLHNLQYDMNMNYQNNIKNALEATGQVEVIAGTAPINSNAAAKEEALRLKEAGVELTIFNYAIWCYPQYTAVAANFAPGPYILFCNIPFPGTRSMAYTTSCWYSQQILLRLQLLWIAQTS